MLKVVWPILILTVAHFKDRFADQRWLIYDMKRRYGFYYDLHTVEEVTFDQDTPAAHLVTGMLDESLMDKDEKLFQQLWKTYFKSITIRERLNPRKHKQDMPVRYWKYITEKQKWPYSIRSTVTSGNSCINDNKCPSSLFRLDLMTIVTW